MKNKTKVLIVIAIITAIAILSAILLLHNHLAPAPNATTDTDTPIVTVDRPTNFEGKVAETAVGGITLDNGKIVKITDDTAVTTLDGNDGIIFPGNYIQGYTEDPEGNEIVAEYIIITSLG